MNAWFVDRTSSYMVRSMDYGSGQVARVLLEGGIQMPEEKKGLRPKKRTVGKVFQEYRVKYGWSQDDLAWEAEISRVQIGRIERNECEPTIATLEKLEKALHLPKMMLVEIKQMEDGKTQTAQEEQESAGIAFRELEQTLVKSLIKSELRYVNEAIFALTDELKR